MTLLDQLAQQADRRSRRWLGALTAAVLLLLVLSLCTGDSWISPLQWFSASGDLFVWQLRLPRTLAVLLVGAALAVCGVVMQALFNNPLAEPGLLGVSNGAGIGLVLAVLLGNGALWSLALAAMAGALLITLILLHFAHRQLSASRLLLTGVALGIICSAIMTWAVYFSTSLDLRQLMYWMMGGFSGIDWRYGWMMLALLPVTLARLPAPGRLICWRWGRCRRGSSACHCCCGAICWCWRWAGWWASAWRWPVRLDLSDWLSPICCASAA